MTASPSEETEKAPPESKRSTVAPGRDGKLLRYAFYLVWVMLIPGALATFCIWLFTPAPGAQGVGGLQQFVEDQPIPCGIIFFALFAVVLWRFRHDLPFASSIGVAGRKDIPAKIRARYEDAGALLEEAHRILRTKKKQVKRELTATEREQVDIALDGLEQVMSEQPFNEDQFDQAIGKAERVVGDHLSRWRKSEIREYGESIFIAIAVALVLRAFVVEAFKIPSGSMMPTLMIGDHIFVNKLAYGPLVPFTNSRLLTDLPPDRGDVAVFIYPENEEQDFIKRIVAGPGDHLDVVGGRPIINGLLVPNCHVGTYEEGNPSLELYVEYLGDHAYYTLFKRKQNEGGLFAACETAADCQDAKSCKAGVCGMLQGPFDVKPEEVFAMGDNRHNSHDSRFWRGGLGAGVPYKNIKGRAMFVWWSSGKGTGVAAERIFVNVMGTPELPKSHAHLQPKLDECLRNRPDPKDATPPAPKGF